MSNKLLEDFLPVQKKSPERVLRSVRMLKDVDDKLDEIAHDMGVTKSSAMHALISQEWAERFRE